MKKSLLLFLLVFVVTSVNARYINSTLKLDYYIKNSTDVVSAYVQNSNIFIRHSDGSIKQLTFANSDSSPIVSKKENAVLFIRKTVGSFFSQDGSKINGIEKLMKVNCQSLIEKTITDQKPFRDGLDNTYYILNIRNLTLSLDEMHVYFAIECYVTGDELVKVDLSAGKMIKVFPVDYFELIKKGQCKGLFFIGRSEIKGGGRKTYYYLVNEKNETLKEFNSEDSYRAFRKNAIDN